MNNLYNNQNNVTMRKLSMDEMAEINGGKTAKQWLCDIGTGAAASVVGWGISFVSGGAGALVAFGLGILGDWMCDTYAD